MRYLDPKNDLTFKKIFGTHPHLTISFLNSLLPLEDDALIESIEYLPSDLVPIVPIFKNSIVDVRCKDKKGRQFIVEMQMLWTDGFKQRVLFNSAKSYVSQLKVKKDYRLLEPVYSLNIVNENFEPETKEFYHHYTLVCNHDTHMKIEGLEMVFIELQKFQPKDIVQKRLNILWLRFLKELDGNVEVDKVSKDLSSQPEIKEALDCLMESSFTELELEQYQKYWDYVSTEITLKGSSYERGAREERAKTELELASKNSQLEEAKAREEEAKAREEEAKAREEEAKAREEEAKAREEEERKLKEEALNKAQDILKASVLAFRASGMSDIEISKILGVGVD
ncbi:MAG: Rpn family recombination-promoting nuclease/putative transposase, partial [Cytophagales bacterium]